MRITTVIFLLGAVACAQTNRNQGMQPTDNEPLSRSIDIFKGYVRATGHWVPTDGQQSNPRVSLITCDRTTMTCHELIASAFVLDGMVFLGPDENDYPVTRWDDDEVVAFLNAPACGVGHSIKILLKEKRVFKLDAPTEPVTDKTPQWCAMNRLDELKGGTTFWPTK